MADYNAYKSANDLHIFKIVTLSMPNPMKRWEHD